MHDEIEAAPLAANFGKDAVDAFQIYHIAVDDDLRADGLGERDGPPAEGIALVSESQLGAMAGQHARDTPGDGAFVGHAHDQAALAGHQWSWFGDVDVRHGHLPLMPRADRHRIIFALCARQACGAHASQRLSTKVALVPPKPKLFDMTQLSATSSRRLRTMGTSLNSGSSVSMLALSQTKPLLSMSRE